MISDYQDPYEQIITGGKTWIYAYESKTTDNQVNIVPSARQVELWKRMPQ